MSIVINYKNEAPKLMSAGIICPKCNLEFDAMEHGTTELGSNIDDCVELKYGRFKCPHCKSEFRTRDKELELHEL